MDYVIVDHDYCESLVETVDILSDPEAMEAVWDGEEDYEIFL